MEHDPDRVKSLWAEYSPRIEEAERRDSEESSIVFVDLHEEKILALPAIVLDLERYLLLHQAGVFDGSCGGDRDAVLLFLWIVNPNFKPNPRASRKFFRKHRKLNLLAYSAAIEYYVRKMFAGSKDDEEEAKKSSSSGNDWVGSIIDLLASEYGWEETKILRTPIPRLMKYANRIRLRLGGKEIEFSSESDRLRQEFMERANEGNAHG